MKPNPPTAKALYRLTLSSKAYSIALARKSPCAGVAAEKRPDGRIDCAVKPAVANLLKQLATPGENLSDTVIRIIGESHA